MAFYYQLHSGNINSIHSILYNLVAYAQLFVPHLMVCHEMIFSHMKVIPLCCHIIIICNEQYSIISNI